MYIMKNNIIAILICLLACSVICAQAPNERTSKNDTKLQKMLERFPEADADGNGVLTLSELQAFKANKSDWKQKDRPRPDPKANRDRTDKPDPKTDRARKGRPARKVERPTAEPTMADVKYAPHERNVLDFYQAKSDKPAPVVLFIHGGGFRGGSKESLNADTLQKLLAAGISVAAVEYRVISDKPLPAAHYDALRALQFIRSKANKWNIDKTRVGAFGGSAGAQICMWLAFHDEMADASSCDPVQHESSRLTCVATSGGQTTMVFDWWMKWIPGYDKPHRNRAELFGDITDEELRRILKDISALSLITADDPPIFMSYGMKPDDPVPADSGKAQGWKVHHVMFGVKLKEKMDELGVEADLKYPTTRTTYGSNTDFFIKKLKPSNG